MKILMIVILTTLLLACSPEDSVKDLTTIDETAKKYSPSKQIHETLDKAKNVEALLQQGKDKRDAEMNAQLQ